MQPVRPANLVDVDRYPVENLDGPSGTGFLASCRSELREKSICVLEGFVKPDALRHGEGDLYPDPAGLLL